MSIDYYASETGYYNVQGHTGSSPDLTVMIGKVYTFDQTDETNYYHPVGLAFYPDGAHGADWGGEERAEVEGPYLKYKIDGAAATCPHAGDTGLDCYEPEFFYPRAVWSEKSYSAELTVTQALADASCGGVIYYFCHIHSRMSGRIIIKNADGSDLSTTGFACPTELDLYEPVEVDAFDADCGTYGAKDFAAGGSSACDVNFLEGTLDTTFENCLQAIDCKMVTEMRVLGYDEHASAIATFMQQMIPHHLNAVNMAKVLLKHAPLEVEGVPDLTDILWNIINVQNYQVHQFRAYLATHPEYVKALDDKGNPLDATSVGHHCSSSLASGVDLTIEEGTASSGATSDIAGCDADSTVDADNAIYRHTVCVKVNLFAGESGYYEFAGETGPSPEITARIGHTLVFDQSDPSNWYHPIGFAYYPDGAHGDEWGGDERDEVEGLGELLYKIDGEPTTCPDAGDTGLDCYEPEFFYPRADCMAKKYSAELTITQEMADKSHGGVIYYFCHIHSKMSGKIRILPEYGSDLDTSALDNPDELTLYSPVTLDGVDLTCGTTDLEEYAGGGDHECDEAYLCGDLDTTWEKCMQAIDCKMATEMKSMTIADSTAKFATFCQQMIPHHLNAVNMAKILITQVSESEIEGAMEDSELTNILYSIINVQNFQVHQFRNYLGSVGYYHSTTDLDDVSNTDGGEDTNGGDNNDGGENTDGDSDLASGAHTVASWVLVATIAPVLALGRLVI
jgi:uncharacterized protein (DUF305 family)/plastocyanin